MEQTPLQQFLIETNHQHPVISSWHLQAIHHSESAPSRRVLRGLLIGLMILGVLSAFAVAAFHSGSEDAPIAFCIGLVIFAAVMGVSAIVLDEQSLRLKRKYGGFLEKGETPADIHAVIQRADCENDREAQRTVGEYYFSGHGVPRDYQVAMVYFTQAAENGCEESAFNLATMYARGWGVDTCEKMEYKWSLKASQMGSLDAARRLKELV